MNKLLKKTNNQTKPLLINSVASERMHLLSSYCLGTCSRSKSTATLIWDHTETTHFLLGTPCSQIVHQQSLGSVSLAVPCTLRGWFGKKQQQGTAFAQWAALTKSPLCGASKAPALPSSAADVLIRCRKARGSTHSICFTGTLKCQQKYSGWLERCQFYFLCCQEYKRLA